MRKRRVLEGAVYDVLGASSGEEVELIVGKAVDEATPRQDTDSDDLRLQLRAATADYHRGQAGRQIVHSALGELAARKVIPRIWGHFNETGSVLTDMPPEEESFSLSPNTQRFIATMDCWFGSAIKEVIEEARRGALPHSAIFEGGQKVYADYAKAVRPWQEAMYASGRNPVMTGSPRVDLETSIIVGGYTGNIIIAAELVFGQGIQAKQANPEASAKTMGRYTKERLGHMARLSSAGRSITVPLIRRDRELYTDAIEKDTGEIVVDAYSAWESGAITAEDFYELGGNIQAPVCPYHVSLEKGRWQNPGMCAADMRFVRPEDFTVTPQELLQTLGVVSAEYNNMATLFLGVATQVAQETLFTNWPEVEPTSSSN